MGKPEDAEPTKVWRVNRVRLAGELVISA